MKIFEIHIFGLTIAPTYYGLMYALGFLIAYKIIVHRKIFTKAIIDDFFLYVFFGVILGGRLGYILFYNFQAYLDQPLAILKVWEGGMSFHGGVVGVIVTTLLFTRKNKLSFLKLIDEVALTVPIGLGLGRIGNHLNGELLGYGGYTGPFAVNGRFPSPLLEAILEGPILMLILYIVAKKKKFAGQIGALFLIGYGFFRTTVEVLFRVPDAHIGYLFGRVSMGALLSLFMILVGCLLYFRLSKNK